MPSSETPTRAERSRMQRRRLLVLGVLALAGIALFMLWDVNGLWSFALPRRAIRVATMVLVAAAVGHSTVVFQTITGNRILTPSVMGYDVLFVLLQAVLAFTLGTAGIVRLGWGVTYALEVVVMVGFAVALFRWIFSRGDHGVYTLVLIGIVCGTLFRSLATLVFRVLEPNEFDALQDRLFASLNRVDPRLLIISAVIVAVVILADSRLFPTLDVLTLGRDPATTLGVAYRPTVTRLLVSVSILVAVATALIGPVVFLGLLTANLAYELLQTHRHRLLVPAASLLGIIALVGGQAILEHLLGFNAAIGMIINIVGGTYFILLLVKEAHR